MLKGYLSEICYTTSPTAWFQKISSSSHFSKITPLNFFYCKFIVKNAIIGRMFSLLYVIFNKIPQLITKYISNVLIKITLKYLYQHNQIYETTHPVLSELRSFSTIFLQLFSLTTFK